MDAIKAVMLNTIRLALAVVALAVVAPAPSLAEQTPAGYQSWGSFHPWYCGGNGTCLLYWPDENTWSGDSAQTCSWQGFYNYLDVYNCTTGYPY